MYPFNVRVYGLLVNERNEVLISDEKEYGMLFTKFPGGGLEAGEGLIDGLKREFMEECNTKIEITGHFYTTDFYVKSTFNDSQVISIYYLVINTGALTLNFKTKPFDFDSEGEVLQAFRWINISKINPDEFPFPADKHVAKLLKN